MVSTQWTKSQPHKEIEISRNFSNFNFKFRHVLALWDTRALTTKYIKWGRFFFLQVGSVSYGFLLQ